MATAQRDAREHLADWWRSRTRPERTGVAAIVALAALALAWLLIGLPAQRDTERLTRELASQRAALAAARQQADAMAGLERRAPAPARDARASLDAVLSHAGVKPGSIEGSGEDRWRVTIDAIPFDALARIVDALQRDAALHVVDLTATARVEPGTVRADFTVLR